MNRTKYVAMLVFLCMSPLVAAWEAGPPIPIERALAGSKCAYAAMVQAVSLADTKGARNSTPLQLRAVAKLKILDCLLGTRCRQGDVVTVQFLAESEEEIKPAEAVEFPVGKNMILALKASCASVLDFDSHVQGGVGAQSVDSAYVCDTFPYTVTDRKESFTCEDAKRRGLISRKLYYAELKGMVRQGHVRE